MDIWPIPIRVREASTGLIAIGYIIVRVVTLDEVSLARVGIEGRSRGLVVI